MQDRGEADQDRQQSKKPPIRGKSIDSPNANCADDDDYQNADQGRNRVCFPSPLALTFSPISTGQRLADVARGTLSLAVKELRLTWVVPNLIVKFGWIVIAVLCVAVAADKYFNYGYYTDGALAVLREIKHAFGGVQRVGSPKR